MSTSSPASRLRRPGTIVAAVAASALIGWGLLHPEFRPDPGTIAVVIRNELAKTGFKGTRGISSARFETVHSMGGLSESWAYEQRIVPVDELITEKQTRGRAARIAEETVGLYVGPLAVVRFNRIKPPFIGELLPFHFWTSSHMSEFVVEEADNFPGTKGGKLRAKVTYEDRYADGELLQTERRLLQCNVTEVVTAATVNPALSGAAARIECREELEPDGRKAGPANPQTWSQGSFAYTHWYILDRHWSISTEGGTTIRREGTDEVRKWSSKLISFDPAGQ